MLIEVASGDLRSERRQALYPGLSSGPRQIPAEEVARHQRIRLEGATVEAVARHGYAGTTLSEVVGLAGVSKTTFYEHFESKEKCFWATFETIVSVATENVLTAYHGADDQDGKLCALLEAYGEVPVASPKATALVVIEALCLGQEGVRRRARSAEPIERVFRELYEEYPQRVAVSTIETKAVVAGLRHVTYRSLRARRPDALATSTDELARWILSYQRPEREGRPRATLHDGEDLDASARRPTLGWDEPPDSPDSRVI
jgi:AcrR family transcriptional regulator